MDDQSGSRPDRFRLLSTIPTTVSAKQCLWFTWAKLNFKGPYGEDESYRPSSVVIPPHISHVTIRVTTPDTPENYWWHGPSPSYKSNADGRPETRGLQKEAYRTDPDYQSSNIHPITTNLNKLLMLVGDTTPPDHLVSPVPVGRLLEDEPIPGVGNSRLIFFGMHDGYEWSNNGGTVMDVEVDLLTELT